MFEPLPELLDLCIDLAVHAFSRLALALVLNTSFLLLEADLRKVAVVLSTHLVHNFAELAAIVQELLLDLVFEFARVSSVHLVCVHLRIVFFFGVGAQELQPHDLILLEVFDRSFVLALEGLIHACE